MNSVWLFMKSVYGDSKIAFINNFHVVDGIVDLDIKTINKYIDTYEEFANIITSEDLAEILEHAIKNDIDTREIFKLENKMKAIDRGIECLPKREIDTLREIIVENGKIDLLKLFVQSGIEFSREFYFKLALKYFQTEIAKYLSEEDFDIKKINIFDLDDIIVNAIKHDRPESIEFLVSLVKSQGIVLVSSPLTCALVYDDREESVVGREKRLQFFKTLLTVCDPNKESLSYKLPMKFLVKNSKELGDTGEKMFSLLLEHGAILPLKELLEELPGNTKLLNFLKRNIEKYFVKFSDDQTSHKFLDVVHAMKALVKNSKEIGDTEEQMLSLLLKYVAIIPLEELLEDLPDNPDRLNCLKRDIEKYYVKFIDDQTSHKFLDVVHKARFDFSAFAPIRFGVRSFFSRINSYLRNDSKFSANYLIAKLKERYGEHHRVLDLLGEVALESGYIEPYKHFEIEYNNSKDSDMEEASVIILVMTILNDKSSRDSDEISKYIEALEFAVLSPGLLDDMRFKSVMKNYPAAAEKLREYYHEGYEYKIKRPIKNSEQELFSPAKDQVEKFMDDLEEDSRPVFR